MSAITKTLYNLTRSSTGTGNLSLTIKGLITAIIPVAVYFGFSDVELNAVGDAAVTIIGSLGTIISAVMVIVGFIRKVIAWIRTFSKREE